MVALNQMTPPAGFDLARLSQSAADCVDTRCNMEDWQRLQALLKYRTRLADLESRFGAKLDAMPESEYRSVRARARLVPIQLEIAIKSRKAPIVRLELLKAVEAIEGGKNPEAPANRARTPEPELDRFDIGYADLH